MSKDAHLVLLYVVAPSHIIENSHAIIHVYNGVSPCYKDTQVARLSVSPCYKATPVARLSVSPCYKDTPSARLSVSPCYKATPVARLSVSLCYKATPVARLSLSTFRHNGRHSMTSRESRTCITCVSACRYNKRSCCLTQSLELPRVLDLRSDLLNNVQGNDQ